MLRSSACYHYIAVFSQDATYLAIISELGGYVMSYFSTNFLPLYASWMQDYFQWGMIKNSVNTAGCPISAYMLQAEWQTCLPDVLTLHEKHMKNVL